MFCGTSAFHQMAAADDPAAPSKTSKKHGGSKNPYSSRGLDKFSSVLSELDARKQKIMASASSHGVAFVRFMYSDSDDWVPVIVRQRENNNKPVVVTGTTPPPPPPPPPAVLTLPPPPAPEKKESGMVWWRWRPSYYVPAALLLILLCFVISGRAFAVCCTSAFWYLMPVLKGDVKDKSLKNFIYSAYRNSYKHRFRRNYVRK